MAARRPFVVCGYCDAMTNSGRDDDEAAALQRMSVLIRRVYQLQDEEAPGNPVATSRLHDVDAALGGFPLTHNVTRCLSVSLDHLHALSLLLHKAEAQNAYAGFTLLRGSLETIGVGMWLLAGGSRTTMIERNLILELANDRDRERAFANTSSAASDDGSRRARLLSIASQVDGVSLSIRKEPFRSSTAVRDGSAAFGFDSLMLTAWQGASGIAHGRTWAILSLSDRIEIPGTRDVRGASFRMTSNTESLAGLFFVAVAAHDVLRKCFAASLAGRTDLRQQVAAATLAELARACAIGESP